jgi:hypothetical protein
LGACCILDPREAGHLDVWSGHFDVWSIPDTREAIHFDVFAVIALASWFDVG